MKPGTEGAAAGRIVLALEHLGEHAGAVELALRLAQSRRAELAGVLIEDLNLLRAAALPFACEIMAHAGEERPVGSALMQARLRRQAQRMQAEIERKAGAEGVRTSFRTVRGVGVRAALELREEADLFVVGRRGRGRWAGAGAAARIVAVEDPGKPAEPLEAAVRRIEAELTAGTEAAVERVAWRGAADLAAACRSLRPALLVAPAALVGAEALDLLLERVDCPVVLVA
ncbi:MAG: hypothetical protein ISP90_07000 [Nevskia sp.]|nr:hypothetical protein [Nevskia sp.]